MRTMVIGILFAVAVGAAAVLFSGCDGSPVDVDIDAGARPLCAPAAAPCKDSPICSCGPKQGGAGDVDAGGER